ncbi:hypothetical protein PVK06_038666 [Gossypium arboreum]|uniref:Uncharacterized protein n=1 Tax=Gossypium arboreum TaxID=29729 RepID=A0ABR0N0Z6_GOSAR|nr:hypothetical protein PVK06_038666 [Gossypium arboreum]
MELEKCFIFPISNDIDVRIVETALKLPIAANAATTVKAITAVKAIETYINMGLSYGIIGGDTRVIMKGLNGKEHFSEIGPILDKAKFLLQ